jgi:methylated-DNA-[protein]-cysteine S-methyltransferase
VFADEFLDHASDNLYNAHYDRPVCLSLLGDVAQRTVLDAACGPGLYAEELSNRGADVIGVDQSPENRISHHHRFRRLPVMSTRHTTVDTVLGNLTLVAENDTLVGLYFPGHWRLPPRTDFGPPVATASDALFTHTAAQLHDYLHGARTGFELPIALYGTPGQMRVWNLLTDIPYGETVTYGELATALGATTAWEVGQAVGRNPVSIVVPCHRVVGRDGRLTGYAGGLARKRFLLEREESTASRLSKLF